METNIHNFQHDVLEASNKRPILVDFWAPWCSPCKVISPILEKLSKQAEGSWSLVKVNTDEEQQLAQKFRIQSIPNLKIFINGEVVAEFVGAKPEAEIIKWLEQYIPSKKQKLIEKALEIKQMGDTKKAEKIFQKIIKQDPTHPEALVSLAELIFARDLDKALDLIKNVKDDGTYTDRLLAMTFLAQLKNRVKNTNGQSKAFSRYEEGYQAFNQGNYEQAAQAWIDVVTLDNKLDNGGGRMACVSLFRWLGDQHPVTQTYRPRFASALF